MSVNPHHLEEFKDFMVLQVDDDAGEPLLEDYPEDLRRQVCHKLSKVLIPIQKDVLELRLVHLKRQSDIAYILKLSQPCVHYHLSRVRQTWRRWEMLCEHYSTLLHIAWQREDSDAIIRYLLGGRHCGEYNANALNYFVESHPFFKNARNALHDAIK